MDSLTFGRILHEILMDGNFSKYHKLNPKERKRIDTVVISLRVPHDVRVHIGDIVMDRETKVYHSVKYFNEGFTATKQDYIITDKGVILMYEQLIPLTN